MISTFEPLMALERIDTTQFEGLFEPNLLLHVFEEIKGFKDGFKDQTTVWAAKKPPIYFGKQTVDAIEMLPDLVAELKRMYEWKDELIAEVKDLITYDQEDEMWVYDESKSSNPGLDAMDILINLAYD